MYRIHVVARQAGISTQLVRAWERRYGLLTPVRTDTGYRVYSDDDVTLLRGAKALVDQGRSISDVARLPREQLRQAAGRVADPGPAAGSAASESFLDAALTAIVAYDATRLDSLIFHATGMGALSSTDICDSVLLPLLAAIGERWEAGSLDISAEHFGSSIVRRHLHVLLQDEARRNQGGPVIVCACPAGNWHEGGLLSFALHAATQGWAPVYLGANTPVDEVVSAAEHKQASAIAMSLTAPCKRAERRNLLDRLAAWRSKRPGRIVWIGGSEAAAHAEELASAGLEYLPVARLPVQPALANR
jgi:DNA-binding transcriptional MerR regulator/methylmalonyl-CoA mutase cobalamin-binding subunit